MTLQSCSVSSHPMLFPSPLQCDEGGRRLLVVPPELGFGSTRQAIGDNVVPPNSELEYDITLQRISIPPS
jgi:hypothetical protein